ncbi:MAG TPA: hypothetical protein PKH79_07290 [Prolixibacteraceae bacterium]|nr:hypothetical protein [Prolixibacteraceae bacterium]
MRKFSYISFLMGFLFTGVSVLAQNDKGIEAFYSEMYPTSKQFFLRQLADSAEKPEACYYLGEIYRLTNYKDSAMCYFESGAQGDNPNPLCLIGKAGMIMYNNSSLSVDLINKARWNEVYREKAILYIALARAYADNKKFQTAYEMLDLARSFEPANVLIALNEGDILLQQIKPGPAASKFEAAIAKDSLCKPAYLKLAQIYHTAKNNELSMKYLSKLMAFDAKFPPALKLYGDICYEQGKYAGTVSAYKEYLGTSEADLKDQIRYAYALFFNKDYQQAGSLIPELIQYYPRNQVLKRLLAYSLYEMGNYDEGLRQMDSFLRSVDASIVVPSDYKYYARLLGKNNQDSLSIVYYKKAAVLSTTPQEYYKEMASVYEKMNQFGNAASFMEKYIAESKNPLTTDYLLWGRDCYLQACAIDSLSLPIDSTRAGARLMLYQKADSVFEKLASLTPDNYLGYLWRARVNAVLDPETNNGLAKPYYEKVMELLEKSGNNKKELIESYQYLGYFYFVGEDFQKSKAFWKKILAIDPSNEVALKAMDGIK